MTRTARRGCSRLRPEGSKKPGRESREVAAAKKAVVDALETSLRLAPEHLETYRLLVSIHGEWGDDEGLAAAARRLLAKFPEDVRDPRAPGSSASRPEGSPRGAAVRRSRPAKLKPLDDSLRTLEWLIRVGLARQYALEKKWDEGRAEFAIADELDPGGPSRLQLSGPQGHARIQGRPGRAGRPLRRAGPGDIWSSRHRSGWRS